MMIKKFLFAFILISIGFSAQGQYITELPGTDYKYRTLHMADDYAGKVVCTLVKREPVSKDGPAILYVHGYNDYFFQRALGDSAATHGYNFYALDLRKYGRSILPDQDAFFAKNLSEYFADLDTAIAIIKAEGNRDIVLMAHSTGGLITPLYLQSKGNKLPVSALILNSPFLDMNMSWFMEEVVIPVISFIGNYFPNLEVEGKGISQYAHSLLKRIHGEWEYNENWKKTTGHPKKAGWIHAIHKGHKTIQKGLNLTCPILVMSSDKSIPETKIWNELYHTSDIVLDVKDIQKNGKMLGSRVTCKQIHNGKHDLILSNEPARKETYQVIFSWLKQQSGK